MLVYQRVGDLWCLLWLATTWVTFVAHVAHGPAMPGSGSPGFPPSKAWAEMWHLPVIPDIPVMSCVFFSFLMWKTWEFWGQWYDMTLGYLRISSSLKSFTRYSNPLPTRIMIWYDLRSNVFIFIWCGKVPGFTAGGYQFPYAEHHTGDVWLRRRCLENS